MSKCNWMFSPRCKWSSMSGKCECVDDCEHKAAESAKSWPKCPKCDGPLVHHIPRDTWQCKPCCYEQPDPEQRPKMPEPRDGYHATEFRDLKQGDTFFTKDGTTIGTANCDHTAPAERRWIAVKDTPVMVETAVGEFRPADHIVDGNKMVEPANKKAGKPISCDICAKEQCSIVHKGEYACVAFVAKKKPAKAEPVVRYYRTTDYLYRVVDGKCTEVIEPARNGIYPQAAWDWGVETHPQVTHDEYESARDAAKHPAPGARAPIEQMNKPADPELAEMVHRINELTQTCAELVARVNALEGGGSNGA